MVWIPSCGHRATPLRTVERKMLVPQRQGVQAAQGEALLQVWARTRASLTGVLSQRGGNLRIWR